MSEKAEKIVTIMLIIVLLFVFVAMFGCAAKPIPEGMTQAEAKTILQGKNGHLKWGFTLDLGIIEPIGVHVWGDRSDNKAVNSDTNP